MGDDPSAQSRTQSDKFVQEASADGTAEVRLGQLAVERATNPAVKEFAQMMVKDHTQANDQLKSTASAAPAGAPADEPAKKQQKAYEKLSQLSGEEFDKAYIDHMVKDHKNAVKRFKRQAKSDENPELKTFATATLPTLERHLDEAERIKSELKGDTPRGTSGTIEPPHEGHRPGDPGSTEPGSPSPMPDPEPRTDPRP
jgi:putative membrane protein